MHLTDRLAEPAGDHVRACDIDRPGLAGLLSFQRQRASHPVDLAGHVVIDLVEAEGGEPARGSDLCAVGDAHPLSGGR